MLKNTLYILILSLTISTQVEAGIHKVHATSDSKSTVSILELYTSEGCSSCPPAEKFLRETFRDKLSTDQVIPLAFHVDYWNYIGWDDPFSKPEHTIRQRNIAAMNNLRSIYTPQFVLHGVDFRRSKNLEKAVDLINQIKPRANIYIEASKVNEKKIKVLIKSENNTSINKEDMVLRIALYENNLFSTINAGENNGKRLQHDYVVRNFSMPYTVKDSVNEIESILDIEKSWKPEDMGVVVFIQRKSTHEILQAVNLPLDKLY